LVRFVASEQWRELVLPNLPSLFGRRYDRFELPVKRSGSFDPRAPLISDASYRVTYLGAVAAV
jgi:hypothetical protein